MSKSVNESKVLIEIENFVEDIVNRNRKSRHFYEKLTDLLIQFSQVYNNKFDYVAVIGAFIELLFDIREYLDDYDCLYKRLTKIKFEDIQQDFKKYYRRHKRQLRDHRYSESQNTKNLINRMQRVSDKYSRILVVRVDLAYPLKYQDQVGIQEFSNDMEVLRTRLRDQDTVFDGLVEYAWALEQGESKGYHCHLLLVYRGSQHRNAYWLADQVGKLWDKITAGQGCHFNCHTTDYLKQFSDRNCLGIGMIHRKNREEVNNMLNTVKYLVRPEKEAQHLRVKCKKRMRTFS
jgi:hypothetical protein